MYSVTVRSYSSARSIIWFLISAGIRTVSVVEVPFLARFGGLPVFGCIASVKSPMLQAPIFLWRQPMEILQDFDRLLVNLLVGEEIPMILDSVCYGHLQ